MDWGYKAVLTTVSVALVLLVGQAFGRRVAGMLAGLPIITAPALLWVASENSASFASQCAIGSIAACGLMATFALAYERISRVRGPTVSITVSMVSMVVVAAPAAALVNGPLSAILFALACCLLAVIVLPAGSAAAAAPARQQRWGVVYTAVSAGVVSVVAGLVAGQFGPFWAGVLAALPIISAAALVNLHRTATHSDIQRFLRGYVAGLSGKALFALAFATLVAQLGVQATLGVAILAGLATSFSVARGIKWFEQRSVVVCA